MKDSKELSPNEVYERQVAVIQNVDLNTESDSSELSFVDLKQVDLEECNDETQSFIKSNLEHGGRYALWVTEDNVMSDDSEHLYPLASEQLDTLTDSTLSDNDTATAQKAKELQEVLSKVGLKDLGRDTDMIELGMGSSPVSLMDAEPVELKDQSKIVHGIDKSYAEKLDNGDWQVHPVTDTNISFREEYHSKWNIDTTRQVYSIDGEMIPIIKDSKTPVYQSWNGDDLEEKKYSLQDLEDVGKKQIDKLNEKINTYQITPTENNIKFNASLILNGLQQQKDEKTPTEIGDEITKNSLMSPDYMKYFYQTKNQNGKITEPTNTQFMINNYKENSAERKEFVEMFAEIDPSSKDLSQFQEKEDKSKLKEQYQQYLSQQGLQR